MDLSDEDRQMQQDVMQSLKHKKADMKQSVEKWKSEKEANEEAIEQMRANKAARKKEMEEMERLKAALAEEEEEEQNGEGLPDILLDDNKPRPDVVFDRQLSFKSKEQVEMEAALLERVRPLKDVEKMDKSQLEERAKEYWKTITGIIAEKKELSKRLQEQDQQIKEVQERLAAFMLAKQSKKGVDMERLALGPGGKASKHPPKKQMTSKFENRKGNRTYEERKGMYDAGVAQVRPKMLVNVWQAKFSAWMEDDDACSFLDGVKKEDEL